MRVTEEKGKFIYWEEGNRKWSKYRYIIYDNNNKVLYVEYGLTTKNRLLKWFEWAKQFPWFKQRNGTYYIDWREWRSKDYPMF